jgi:RHS repeat-associated protein
MTGVALVPLTVHGYNGERHDPVLGLLDQRSRLLDPSSGRFTWRDGFVPPAGNFHDANLYAYVAGNPTNAVDPTGMFIGGVSESIAVTGTRSRLQAMQLTMYASMGVATLASGGLALAYFGYHALTGTTTSGAPIPPQNPHGPRIPDLPRYDPGRYYFVHAYSDGDEIRRTNDFRNRYYTLPLTEFGWDQAVKWAKRITGEDDTASEGFAEIRST